MAKGEFTLRFPVFAIKASEGEGTLEFIAVDMRMISPKRSGLAVTLFTESAFAEDYLRANGWSGQIREFNRETMFRKLVRAMRGGWLAINPRRVRPDKYVAEHVFRAATFEEQHLSEPWSWDFPVYVLYTWSRAYHCLDGERVQPDGALEKNFKMVVVLTDSDLADREAMLNPALGLVAVPIQDQVEFVRFLRELPTDVRGAIFDPRTSGRLVSRTFKLRDELIANLEERL